MQSRKQQQQQTENMQELPRHDALLPRQLYVMSRSVSYPEVALAHSKSRSVQVYMDLCDNSIRNKQGAESVAVKLGQAIVQT